MTHAADSWPKTETFTRVGSQPAEPTISEQEIQEDLNHHRQRFDFTGREIAALEVLLRNAAKRLDAPLLGGGR
jgi:hypothetical protein